MQDRDGVMRAAAERIIAWAAAAVDERGRFDWALAGGSTPDALYALLASREYAARVDWSRVRFFWSDERCVPPGAPASNYRMAHDRLLAPLGIDARRIHRMHGELPPPLGAEQYQAELARCFDVPPGSFPVFDLVLLGLGTDGHTASLFPGTDALEERQRWVVASSPEGLVPRLTLTLPVIDAAEHVLFLTAGAEKAQALAAVLAGTSSPALPAQRVRPRARQPEWIVDCDAARGLEGRRERAPGAG